LIFFVKLEKKTKNSQMAASGRVKRIEARKACTGDHEVIFIEFDQMEMQIDWTGSSARILEHGDTAYFSQVQNPRRVPKDNLTKAKVLQIVKEEEEAQPKPRGYNCVRFVDRILDACCLEMENPDAI
jgi:hypothetical protein